jgi:tetratricopeptide (TPR) repeat protein
MKTIDFSYYIERFNAGEMSDTEKQWFLKELEGNENLRREVSLRKQTDEILKKKDVRTLRDKLSEIEKQRAEAKASSTISRRPVYFKYAALMAGIVIIGSLMIFRGKNLSSEDILKQYYKVYEPPTSQRSANAGTDADFTLALEFYNAHDYDKAAALFNKVLGSKPNDMQTVLLIGVTNFEEKKYPEAKQSFGRVIDDKNNLYVDHARWYLALCYLNTSETEKAKQLFTLIGSENGIYQNDARKIVRGLK